VVAGGGFSGVETIGEIVEMLHRSLKYYPNISKEELNPIVVQDGQALLPELDEKLGFYTKERFEKRGIKVILGQRVSRVTDLEVTLEGGDVITAGTVISSIGNRPPQFIQSLNLELERNRIPVGRDLRAKDTESIWALGDIALVPLDEAGEKFAPPTAQFAVREAKRCASNLVAHIKGKKTKPFAYKPRGSLASLGSYSGVGELMGVKVSGFLGWVIWRTFYISMIPNFAAKVRILLNWFYDYFFPRSIVYLQQKNTSSITEMHFAAGEEVYHKGQVLDALYIIKSGKCVLHSESGHKHEYLPGDHFGERIIQKNRPVTGEFLAEEDSVVLRFERTAFTQLREAMPGLDNYFSQIDPEKYTPENRD